MPRSLLLILLAAVFVSVAPAAQPKEPDEKKPVLYFPTKVGAKWVYEFKNGRPDRVEVVTKVEKGKSGALLVTVGTELRGSVEMLEKFEVSLDGLFEVENDEFPYDPPLCRLKLPAKPGEKWDLKTTNFLKQKVDYGTRTAGGFETVKVPAGTYKAVLVYHDRLGGPEGKIERVSWWYAPDVGVVKLDGPRDELKMVLKSFTPGKD